MADKTLATFRIDPEKWSAFKTTANFDGTNASALLTEFVDKYLTGNKLEIEPKSTETHIDTIESHCIDNIALRLDKLEINIDRLPASLDELIDQRIEERLASSLDVVRSRFESQLEELRGKIQSPVEVGNTTGLVDGSIVLEPESILVEELRSVEAEVEELRRVKTQLEYEVEELRGVKAELKKRIDKNIDSIDLGTLVNRTLTKLKVGSQSPQGKAIKTFVKDLQVELARLPIPQDQLVVPEPTVSNKGRSATPTQWEDRVEIALGGLNWNG